MLWSEWRVGFRRVTEAVDLLMSPGNCDAGMPFGLFIALGMPLRRRRKTRNRWQPSLWYDVGRIPGNRVIWALIRQTRVSCWISWNLGTARSVFNDPVTYFGHVNHALWGKPENNDKKTLASDCANHPAIGALTYWSRVTYICVSKIILVQMMAWRLFGTKPLSEPMLEYC